MDISIIIPVLNEQCNLGKLLTSLRKQVSDKTEIIGVDGGSSDDSLVVAHELSDTVICAAKGRSMQMNAGANRAKGNTLLFLHADTRLPDGFYGELSIGFAQSNKCWGRFNVQLSGQQRLFRVIESFMNWRSRLTGIATGDQAIFVRRAAFEKVNGFPPVPLMEDIRLSTKLKSISRPYCSRLSVTTSSRKWEQQGIMKTVWLMWRLRFAHYCGTDPEKLAGQYYS